MSSDFTIEETAYHESGHVVASVYLCLPFSSVDIDRSGNELGGVSYPERRVRPIPFFHSGCCHGGMICDQCAAQRLAADSAIIAAICGPVAQSSFHRREDADYGDEGDQIEAANICRTAFGDDSDLKIQSRLHPLLERAQQLILNEKAQAELKAVAGALVEKRHLEAEEVHEVMRRAEADWLARKGR